LSLPHHLIDITTGAKHGIRNTLIDFLPGDPADSARALVAAATAAEDIGATLFTLADHFFQMEVVGREEDPFLEGYTSLGFLAGQTTNITLAMLVTGVTYATRACWPRPSLRSTYSCAASRCWASGPAGMSANT
jgi:hypothetical protein